eukprot:633333-Ditylum_brightwellii.AAC.1
MVPDKEKFKENIQQAEEKYNNKENDEMRMVVAFLHQYLIDDNNKLTKFLPHRRVVGTDEMNQCLLEHHKRHFGQAKETPLVSDQLGKEIGYTGEGPVAQTLKQGRAKIEEIEMDAYPLTAQLDEKRPIG